MILAEVEHCHDLPKIQPWRTPLHITSLVYCRFEHHQRRHWTAPGLATPAGRIAHVEGAQATLRRAQSCGTATLCQQGFRALDASYTPRRKIIPIGRHHHDSPGLLVELSSGIVAPYAGSVLPYTLAGRGSSTPGQPPADSPPEAIAPLRLGRGGKAGLRVVVNLGRDHS